MRCGKARDRVDTCLETWFRGAPVGPHCSGRWGDRHPASCAERWLLGWGSGQECARLAQGPWPPSRLGLILCCPLLPAPSSALLCPGSGPLAVSRVPPFLICMFKMYLQSVFLLSPSTPRSCPLCLGAGLCPGRGAQTSMSARFPMPASPEGPCSYWGSGLCLTRGLCSLTGAGWCLRVTGLTRRLCLCARQAPAQAIDSP